MLTTQETLEEEPNERSKKAPRHVERLVVASTPNGPRLKSLEDMLYAYLVRVSSTPSQERLSGR